MIESIQSLLKAVRQLESLYPMPCEVDELTIRLRTDGSGYVYVLCEWTDDSVPICTDAGYWALVSWEAGESPVAAVRAVIKRILAREDVKPVWGSPEKEW